MRNRAESKQPGGPDGWAFLFTRAELEMLVHDIDPQVLEAFIALTSGTPVAGSMIRRRR